MSKPVRTRTRKIVPKQLDEDTSAHVIAEYLSLRRVSAAEIDLVENTAGGLTYREIAITFRVSEVLEGPDAFAIAPRYGTAFTLARRLMQALDASLDASRATAKVTA